MGKDYLHHDLLEVFLNQRIGLKYSHNEEIGYKACLTRYIFIYGLNWNF